ncbi:MAG TPA: DUF4349 domain-containing protein [Pyrinomonadaceae bacterium]
MKSPIILLLALLSFTLSCSRAGNQAPSGTASRPVSVDAEPVARDPAASTAGFVAKEVSLSDAAKGDTSVEAVERKIIRNADITIEVASTSEAQHRVTSIAEAYGGFVVTSESKQRESVDPAQRTTDFKLVVRVPANQFGVALDEIKKLATNVPEEKATGQDVTEEFIDLEARIKTQKALEAQFLGIMRQANNVEDALEVQRQIAEVRTEIEKLEGRKRFIENRASLATITVNIQAPKPVLVTTTTGFGRNLRDAISESVEMASGMLLFFVRFVIVMLPVFLFVGLPLTLILRYLIRRAKRERLAQVLATPTPE